MEPFFDPYDFERATVLPSMLSNERTHNFVRWAPTPHSKIFEKSMVLPPGGRVCGVVRGVLTPLVKTFLNGDGAAI
jgi:hypothetical protein